MLSSIAKCTCHFLLGRKCTGTLAFNHKMKRVLVSCLLLVLSSNVISAQSSNVNVEDYCWRDYFGVVPPDALPGGLDKHGNPIYIGQVLHENQLIPGMIYQGSREIIIESAAVQLSLTNNIKILCASSPKKLEWLRTRNDQFSSLNTTTLIPGGFEPNFSTYIGRVFAESETIVGKVICADNEESCRGLWMGAHGKSQLYTVYEILNYNENVIDID